MLITNTVKAIGWINPGVGYWWVDVGTGTNQQFVLWAPDPPTRNLFVPVFFLSLVLFATAAWWGGRFCKMIRTGRRVFSRRSRR